MSDLKNLTVDFEFWSGFYAEDNNCFSWASNKAYLDMNRTMTFSCSTKNKSAKEAKAIADNRLSLRDKGTEIIVTSFRKLSGNFNTWHNDVCTKLIEVYKDNILINRKTNEYTGLTFGQAQKWLNMTLKYLWLLNRLGLITDTNDKQRLDEYGKYFHIPLDSYILRYVARVDKNKTHKFSKYCDNGINQSCVKNADWKIFGSAWSNITDPDKYRKYQTDLAKCLDGKTPLEWELIHWHKALHYYDSPQDKLKPINSEVENDLH